MRNSRFTETQIIGMIKEQEAGLTVAEVCRKHGLSPASFYKLKAKFGGMDVSDVRRLKQLEEENAKLKRLVAETIPSRRSSISRPKAVGARRAKSKYQLRSRTSERMAQGRNSKNCWTAIPSGQSSRWKANR